MRDRAAIEAKIDELVGRYMASRDTARSGARHMRNQIMSDNDSQVPLPDLNGPQRAEPSTTSVTTKTNRPRASPPIWKRCSTCRCRSPPCSAARKMDVGDLLKLGPGTVLELDRKVGEAIDIYVNNRLVARGEVVLVEDKLGVTMTEIIKAER